MYRGGCLGETAVDCEAAAEAYSDLLEEETQKALDDAQKLADEQAQIAENMIRAISDAWLGNLSYLTANQKTQYAEDLLALSVTDDSFDPVAASKLAAEAALLTTGTKEEYIPFFERYVKELADADKEATPTDILNKLDELIKEVITSKDETVDAYIHSTLTAEEIAEAIA